MSSWRLDFYTVNAGSKLIKFCFHCIFSVEEYISQKQDKFLVDPDPNLLYTKQKQARQCYSTCSNATSSAVSVSSDGNSESFPQNEMPLFTRAEMT